jgi:predicted nucleic acid-binding protein
VIAYFDTSALLKLVITEPGADQAMSLWQHAGEVVVSRLAWPQAVAALAAARHLRAADAIHLATALAVMEADSVFVTWNRRRHRAAAHAGLVTAPGQP